MVDRQTEAGRHSGRQRDKYIGKTKRTTCTN